MEYKKLRRIYRLPFVFSLASNSRKMIVPGFEGLSLYVVAKFFIQGIKNGDLNMRASYLAFNFFLALFPSIIFFFTLLPYIPIDNFQDYLFDLLANLLPTSAFEATEETIADILKNPKGGLLSFGFFAALYFSTNGFNAMMLSFNKSFHNLEERSAIQMRLLSILMVFITVILLSLGIALIIGSSVIIHFIDLGQISIFLVLLTKYVILIALCFFFISFNYYLGAKRKEGYRFISPGSILATILTILTSVGFAYYVNNFGNYNKLYGSIGTLIVIILWIFIASFILLLGFDLNTSFNRAKKTHSKRLK